jgi:hypothetical protein
MKVLSVKNPWAGAILLLGKDVENRTWKTEYRGRILIHASRSQDMAAFSGKFSDLFTNPSFIFKLRDGCIIGSVALYDCVQNAKSKWAEIGLWHWLLREPIFFNEPISVRGSLGLWEYSGSLPEKV